MRPSTSSTVLLTGPGVSKPQQPSHRQLSSGSGGGSGRIGASGPGGGGGGGSGGGGLWTTYLRLLEQQPVHPPPLQSFTHAHACSWCC